MVTTHPMERTLPAPISLGLETRSSFREAGMSLLQELPPGTGRLIIDLGSTRQVDSAGLGALMLVQRAAAERRQAVAIRNPTDEIRFLLVLTKLDELFELD